MTVPSAKKVRVFISSGIGMSLETLLASKGFDRFFRKREHISLRYLLNDEGFLLDYLGHQEFFKRNDLFGITITHVSNRAPKTIINTHIKIHKPAYASNGIMYQLKNIPDALHI